MDHSSAGSHNHCQWARNCENPGSPGYSFSSYSSAGVPGGSSCSWGPSTGGGVRRLCHSFSSIAASGAGGPGCGQSLSTNSHGWNPSTGSWVAAAGIPPQEFILVWEEHQLPLVAHFDGCPNHLAYILAQAWHHMERYGMMYPDDVAWVHVIAVDLEESTSEWLVSLHVRAG